MIPAFRANWLLAALLAATAAFMPAPAAAQSTRDQIRLIEQDYARTHAGRSISDAQLEYYLDRLDNGWTIDRIRADMAPAGTWRPAQGWAAREVICSSANGRYSECRVPFQGHAMITQQISASACVEGSTWGNKPGAVWVKNGCRARFGIVSDRTAGERAIECYSYSKHYRECATGVRGPVHLRSKLANSASCIEGNNWGQKPGVVWVRNDCRATFAAGEWTRRPNYAVTCSSTGSRRQVCAWDDRYGTPRMIQQISHSGCVQGSNWGYTRGGGVWVSSGCQATFGYADARYSDYGYRDGMNTSTSSNWTRRANYAVTCSSTGSGRQVCTWDDRYGTPRMIQQISTSACVEGSDWGYTRGGGIWVTDGCRATFGYADASYSDYGYRDLPNTTWVRDPNYSVSCASTNSGRTVCKWDTRYGSPYVVERMSSSACVEGRDWGYDRNGELWVTAGCRARFGYR